MSRGDPVVPKFVQLATITEVRQVDQHLQQVRSIAAKQRQSGIDLCEDLSHLTSRILLGIICNFDEVSRSMMDHDVGPSAGHADSLNFCHFIPNRGRGRESLDANKICTNCHNFGLFR